MPRCLCPTLIRICVWSGKQTSTQLGQQHVFKHFVDELQRWSMGSGMWGGRHHYEYPVPTSSSECSMIDVDLFVKLFFRLAGGSSCNSSGSPFSLSALGGPSMLTDKSNSCFSPVQCFLFPTALDVVNINHICGTGPSSNLEES